MERVLLKMRPASVIAGARVRILVLLVIAGCAAAPRETARTEADVRASEHRAATAPQGVPSHLDRDAMAEAFELLAKSAADSCASCSRDHRRQAFAILEEQFPPGAIVRSDSALSFVRVHESDVELTLRWLPEDDGRTGSELGAQHRLIFRFHTHADQLVGIAEADLTDERIASLCRGAPDGAKLRGSLKIIPFAYGDGPTFLYAARTMVLRVHCKVLEMAVE